MDSSLLLYGMRVIINDTLVAKRPFPAKRWHRGCYANRIRKKWERRFGMKPLISDTEAITSQVGGFIMFSSRGFAAMKAALGEKGK